MKTKYPKILLCEGKHATLKFLINNQEDLAAISLAILTKRFKEGYWYFDVTEDLEKARKEAKENIVEIQDNFPDSIKKQLERDNKQYQDAITYRERELKIYNLIKETVDKKDGTCAIKILNSRQNYEYEGFELEDFDNGWYLK